MLLNILSIPAIHNMQAGTDELSATVLNYKRRYNIYFQPTINCRFLKGQLGRSTEDYGVWHIIGKKQFKRVDHKICLQPRCPPPPHWRLWKVSNTYNSIILLYLPTYLSWQHLKRTICSKLFSFDYKSRYL